MNKYKTILLDIDDTILNFQSNEQQALTRVFRDYAIPYQKETLTLYHQINRSLWEAYEKGEIDRQVIFNERYQRFFDELGIEANGKEADERYRDYLNDGHEKLPYAKELLAFLKKSGFQIFAATNGVKETQYRRLTDAHLLHYFDKLYISEEVGFQKPDIRFFDTIFIENQLNHDEVLMVGDSLSSDIKGGKDYGIDTVWLNWKNQTNTQEINPTYTLKDLKALEKLLKG